MKVIDLLNKIANGEEVPEIINIRGFEFKIGSINAIENYYTLVETGERWLDTIDIKLNDYISIPIEDTFIDIEELKIDENGYIKFVDGIWKGRKMDVSLSNKINDLIKNQKKIIERLNNERN